MRNQFKFIDSFEIINDQMTGKISIPGLNYLIVFTLNIEGKECSLSDFSDLIKKSEKFVACKLDNDQVSCIITEMSKKITDAAYEGSDYVYSEQDILNLANDIKIEKIDFYDEDIVIFFSSGNIFSNMTISCQMDYDSNIEDVTAF